MQNKNIYFFESQNFFFNKLNFGVNIIKHLQSKLTKD